MEAIPLHMPVQVAQTLLNILAHYAVISCAHDTRNEYIVYCVSQMLLVRKIAVLQKLRVRQLAWIVGSLQEKGIYMNSGSYVPLEVEATCLRPTKWSDDAATLVRVAIKTICTHKCHKLWGNRWS